MVQWAWMRLDAGEASNDKVESFNTEAQRHREKENINSLSDSVIGAAIEVHRQLGGPGLLEKVYENALAKELKLRGIPCRQQVQVPVIYKGEKIHDDFVLDLIVDDRIIVEVKATTQENSIFQAQLLTYLRLVDKRFGLLINFGNMLVKDGVHRIVNGY